MDDKKSRRRFLADALFAAGGLTAAALITRATLGTPEPQPVETCTPVPSPDAATPAPDYPMPGQMMVAPPSPPPQPYYPAPGKVAAPR